MTRRLLMLVALALSIYATPAWTLGLSWANGQSNVDVAIAQSCTLLVRATEAEHSLPSEWRLLWVAATASPKPITIVPSLGASIIADVCEIHNAATTPDTISHLITTVHCTDNSGGSVSLARYVVAIAGGVHAKLKLAQVSGLGMQGSAQQEVTINGGTPLAYPPCVTLAAIHRADDSLVVTTTGSELQRVAQVTYAGDDAGPALPLHIVEQDSTHIVASARLLSPLPPGSIIVSADRGLRAAASPPRDTTAFQRGGHFFVRLQAGAGNLQSAASDASLSEFEFANTALRDSLATIGITGLHHAFPGYHHGDVRAHNLIGEPIQSDDLTDIYIMEIPPALHAADCAQRVGALPGVLWSEPEQAVAGLLSSPDDPLLPYQWGLNTTGQSICGTFPGVDIHAPAAWDLSQGSPATALAILDTGIDTVHVEMFNHARLLGTASLSNPLDRDPSRHGTAVAGIAAARGNNSSGIAGVAYNATPWGIPIADEHEFYTVSSVDSGITTAVANQMPILSTALGFHSPAPQALNSACLDALNRGHLIVAAMGNDNANLMVYPAAFANRVYAVGAIAGDGNRWGSVQSPCGTEGSNYGSWIDAAAPGGRLIETTRQGPSSYYDVVACPGGPCSGFGGTSAAAPVAAGVAALLKSYRPTLLGEDLAQIMNRTAGPRSSNPPDVQYGWGLLRADRALQFVTSPRGVFQGWLGPDGSYGALADSANVSIQETFLNVPVGAVNGTHACFRHRMVGTIEFGFSFVATPAVWPRASGSIGWKDTLQFDYNYEVNWGRIVSGSLTQHGLRLETFVYDVRDAGNNHIAWVPTTPESAQIAFTAVGQIPAELLDVAGGHIDELTVSTYPNPGSTRIAVRFTLGVGGVVHGIILDAAGRIVATPVNGKFAPGPHEVGWNRRDLSGRVCPAGVYFLRLDVGVRHMTRKVVVLN